MSSDRAIIVRITGVGFQSDIYSPLTLTSRTVSYLQATAIQGVVTELSAQFSSEIAVFGSMGSDPTATLSVLANTDTLSALMSRGAAEVRGFDESSIQTTAYVTPSPTPTIKVTDASTLAVYDVIRINGIAYQVTSSDSATPGELTAEMAYGSVPQPIPVRSIGGEAVGSTLYASYWQGQDYPTGGVEQQAITISTVEIDAVSAAAETVVFRGVVSRVNIQTSAGTDNQIRVECMSLMGVIKNAPWAPSSAGISVYVVPGITRESFVPNDDQLTPPTGEYFSGVMKVYPNLNMTGPIFEATTTAYDTRFGAMQIRSGPYGGVTGIIDVEGGNVITVSATPIDPELDNMRANGFHLIFNDGYYRQYSDDSELDIALTEGSLSRIRRRRSDDDNRPINLQIDPAFTAQIAFSAVEFQAAIVDLIFGTFNNDPFGDSGVRAWGMAAWIPFPFADIADIIDLGSLNTAFNAAQMATDIPLCQMWNPLISAREPNTFILPVKPEGPKTIGEVLDNIMKNLGLFMVYDRGRISFGRWASENPWPTEVNDGDFAEPKIALTFDRTNSIQSVTVEYPATITADKLAVTKNPIANVERIVNGAGKIVTVGSMMQQGDDYQAGTIGSFAFLNGTNLITRYSQAAGIIEVTLRDSEVDLAVGEYVSFSSEFIPNGAGSMGVVNATGIVLKAVRSWQTPTSSYTLFLPGYLYAANRISQVSVSGRVVGVPVTEVVTIELNAFTDPNSQLNAPKSDPEAFDQTLQRIVTSPKSYRCQLYDEYGTPYGITARLIGVGSTTLQFSANEFDVAVPGDIIVMEFATNAFSSSDDLPVCWDAFQADSTGLVNSDAALSYPWSR
jgi:hypothetical protein